MVRRFLKAKNFVTNGGQAYAKVKMIKTSVLKLNAVADLVRNMHVDDALIQLDFCKRRVAKEVKSCLLSAIANAENNYNLDIDNLYITEIMVGKAFVMKRFMARARGRGNRILKPFCNLKITVSEVQED